MNPVARLVWENGFPRGVHLIVAEQYQLTIEEFRMEADVYSRFGTLSLVFACDFESMMWRRDQERDQFISLFRQSLGTQAIEWRDDVMVWAFLMGNSLNFIEKGEVLLEKYSHFLAKADIRPRVLPSPRVEWPADVRRSHI